MDLLSRVGNADHGVERAATLVQLWRRMFMIKTQESDIYDEELVRRASFGINPELAEAAPFLPKWVAVWSGGASGKVLTGIESFEQSCKVKRKLKASDLNSSRMWMCRLQNDGPRNG